MEAMVEILADRPKAKNRQVAPYLQKKLPFTQATMMTYWVKHMMTQIKRVASIKIWGKKQGFTKNGSDSVIVKHKIQLIIDK